MKNEFNFLDEEEKDLIESFENNEWLLNSNIKEKNLILSAAKNHKIESREVKIKITESDFKIIEQNASKVGISSDLLIYNIIHDYSQKFTQGSL